MPEAQEQVSSIPEQTPDVSATSTTIPDERVYTSDEPPVVDADKTVEPSETEVQEEPGTTSNFSDAEKAEIDKLISKMNLPKGVTWFQHKDGSLKFIVPINGKKYIASPEDVFQSFGLDRAGHEKLNEGKDIIKKTEALFNSIKENPKSLWMIADKLGIDKHELARELLEERIAEESLTPEQKKIRELEAELQGSREEKQRAKQQEEQRQFDAQKAQAAERYDKEITEAMLKHGFQRSNSKTKSHVLAQAVGKMMIAAQAGRELSANDAVLLAKQDWQDYAMGVYGELDPKQILETTPKFIVDAIRKADISELTSSPIADTPTANAKPQLSRERPQLEEFEPNRKEKKKTGLTRFFEDL